MAGIQGQPTPKPSDLQSPVPTAGEADPFAGAQVQGDPFAAAQVNGGGAPAPPDSPGVGAQALDAVGRVADAPGGIVRTTVAAGMLDPNTGESIVKPEDWKAAAVGKAPNSAEYLRRLGVSEGGSLTVPGLGRVTLRGAEGLALDILSDPLTLIAKAIKGAPYIAKVLEAPGRASEALGEAVYKSAITGKNSGKAAKAGEALISEGAPMGGQARLEAKIKDAASTMGNIRQSLYDQFAQAGGKIDVTEHTLENAQGVIKNLRKNPTLVPLADEFDSMLNQYKGQGFVPIDVMSTWKTQLYDSLPKNAFQGAKLTNPGKAFKAALATDFKNAIVNSGNKVDKGLGDAINHVNDKWGALLEAQPMKNPMGGTLGKAIDAAALAAGGVSGLMKKKAFEVAIGPLGRTITGRALMQAGRDGIVDRLARQAVISASKPEEP